MRPVCIAVFACPTDQGNKRGVCYNMAHIMPRVAASLSPSLVVSGGAAVAVVLLMNMHAACCYASTCNGDTKHINYNMASSG
jgi:hypothetical protein